MEKTKQAFISQAGFLTQLHIQNYPQRNQLAAGRLLVGSLRKALSLRNGSSYYVGLWHELKGNNNDNNHNMWEVTLHLRQIKNIKLM